MNFPVTLKRKIDEDDQPYWVAEQKQLDLVAVDFEFDECLDIMRDKVKQHFSSICSDDKFARLNLNLVSARAEIEVEIRINRTLAEFGGGAVDTEDHPLNPFEQSVMAGDDSTPPVEKLGGSS